MLSVGTKVRQVCFNGGDRFYGLGAASLNYRGSAAAWPASCAALLDHYAVTDLVLFGDCRPLHRAAVTVAKRMGVRVLVLEEGYLRPHWITFQEDGVNGNSKLPRNADWYRAEADNLSTPYSQTPQSPAAVPYSFARRAVQDILYTAASLSGHLAFPYYRTHRPWHPLIEYVGWISQLARSGRARARSSDCLERLAFDIRPAILFPLQLDCDYQLRDHSPFASMGHAISLVFDSFSAHAPPELLLIVKQHPLENGLRNWRRRVHREAKRAGILDRVVFIESGEIAALIGRVCGMVTVNSTSAMPAMAAGLPVFVLGTAIYDIRGLTSDGTLDDFWSKPRAPDAALFADFSRVIISRCQLHGGFYSPEGLDLVVDGVMRRLHFETTDALRERGDQNSACRLVAA